MAFTDSELKLFVHRDLLNLELGVDRLRNFFLSKEKILNNSIIKGIDKDGNLDVVKPSLAQQNCSLTETAFQFFVSQKANDGYVYGSVESFKKIVNAM